MDRKYGNQVYRYLSLMGFPRTMMNYTKNQSELHVRANKLEMAMSRFKLANLKLGSNISVSTPDCLHLCSSFKIFDNDNRVLNNVQAAGTLQNW